jgi:hypothetical protein
MFTNASIAKSAAPAQTGLVHNQILEPTSQAHDVSRDLQQAKRSADVFPSTGGWDKAIQDSAEIGKRVLQEIENDFQNFVQSAVPGGPNAGRVDEAALFNLINRAKASPIFKDLTVERLFGGDPGNLDFSSLPIGLKTPIAGILIMKRAGKDAGAIKNLCEVKFGRDFEWEPHIHRLLDKCVADKNVLASNAMMAVLYDRHPIEGVAYMAHSAAAAGDLRTLKALGESGINCADKDLNGLSVEDNLKLFIERAFNEISPGERAALAKYSVDLLGKEKIAPSVPLNDELATKLREKLFVLIDGSWRKEYAELSTECTSDRANNVISYMTFMLCIESLEELNEPLLALAIRAGEIKLACQLIGRFGAPERPYQSALGKRNLIDDFMKVLMETHNDFVANPGDACLSSALTKKTNDARPFDYIGEHDWTTVFDALLTNTDDRALGKVLDPSPGSDRFAEMMGELFSDRIIPNADERRSYPATDLKPSSPKEEFYNLLEKFRMQEFGRKKTEGVFEL